MRALPWEPERQHVGGCQNYDPFWGTLNIRCRTIIGIQKGTIILTTTHVLCGSDAGLHGNRSAHAPPPAKDPFGPLLSGILSSHRIALIAHAMAIPSKGLSLSLTLQVLAAADPQDELEVLWSAMRCAMEQQVPCLGRLELLPWCFAPRCCVGWDVLRSVWQLSGRSCADAGCDRMPLTLLV